MSNALSDGDVVVDEDAEAKWQAGADQRRLDLQVGSSRRLSCLVGGSVLRPSCCGSDPGAHNENAIAADPVGRASTCSDHAQERDKGGGGNLFLTVLRLRFEERGSWSKALETPEIKAIEEVEEFQEEVEDFDVETASMIERRRTWKEYSGRRHGSDAFVPGDIARGLRRAYLRNKRLTKEASRVFRVVGSRLRLIADESKADEGLLNVVERTLANPNDLLNGVAITAAALASRSPKTKTPALRRFYFEFQVENIENGLLDTLELGFVWSPPTREEDLPEAAHMLPRSLVVGGDMPRAYLDGHDMGKVNGWRPLVHVTRNSRIGALLEVQGPRGSEPGSLMFRVYQDDDARAEMRWEPQTFDGGHLKAPHGVVDVKGCVRQVRLLDVPSFPGEV
uniref:Uncharacterized protein n=1 Tax=Noctiluca scintillans TaxID=2966 RepID=A0A7S1A613_NOCSC|mmetsp:Transcript_32467/g.87159  ORF Transcript_32467/g.87159 Transcript_32467/m.87159 type:complete len:394 (+) Transcript_32467:51-1232(+)|eukprot:CAMPEP_0194498382 /NCGR_PEP_ID=MMETSP0253-20130528/15029_1 /TAXON_ID=2966 /ORGANISM="Noctiluca scintillans" /LENGTH=393 /DNA_ID=CAMNT_0039340019 /DNA_START=70 /DNA_END=1251 /DNA_ORIENTATION=+